MKYIFWNFKEAFIGQQLIQKMLPKAGVIFVGGLGTYYGLQNMLTSNIYYDEEFSTASEHRLRR